MCVIAVSRYGERQPTTNELLAMWKHNPHGAGFMYIRGGMVCIRKGFMTFRELKEGLHAARITKREPVVYHFRISTQAGRTPQMTHPFPLTDDLTECERLRITCNAGIAHNGIIRLTSDPTETRYSDTALFVTKYLSKLILTKSDISDPVIHEFIEKVGGWSRFAIMDSSGDITTIGHFTDRDGLLVSNTNHEPRAWTTLPTPEITW